MSKLITNDKLHCVNEKLSRLITNDKLHYVNECMSKLINNKLCSVNEKRNE